MSCSLQDDAKQRAQALHPQQSFIVQAPAGSGKTELLVTRFVTLLSLVKNPEEIVAITFTVKAAKEMHQRVIKALQLSQTDHGTLSPALEYAATQAVAQDKKNAWNIVTNPNRLKIQTIDSFCQTLVRQAPLFNEKTIFTNVEQISIGNNIYQQAARSLLATLRKSSSVDELEKVFRYFGCLGENLEQTIVQMLRQREQWLEMFVQLRTKPLEQVAKFLHANLNLVATNYCDRLSSAFRPWLQRINLLAYDCINFYEDDKLDIAHLSCISKGINNKSIAEQVEYWKSLRIWLLTKNGSLRSQLTTKNGFGDKKVQSEMKLVLDEISQSRVAELLYDTPPATRYQEHEVEILKYFAEVLVSAVTHLLVHFSENNTVDFSGMMRNALDALGTDTAQKSVAEKLDFRIHHILVDEFQDTSYIQCELLRRLIRNWPELSTEHSLFLVGDPQQSIYRFRQAAPGLFHDVQEKGIGHLRLQPIQLTNNFRSSKELIDWYNHTFALLFPEEPDYKLGECQYHKSVTQKQTTNQQAVYFSGNENEQIVNNDIIKQLYSLQQDPEIKSIAILTRTRKQAQKLTPLLQAQNISFTSVELEPLDEQQHIIDLVSLIQALVDEHDRISWLAVLRHPMFAIELVDLAQFTDNHTIWYYLCNLPSTVSAQNRKRINQLQNILRPIMKNRMRAPWEQLIEDAWYRTGIAPSLTKEKRKQGHTILKLLAQNCQGGYVDIEEVNNSIKQYMHSKQGNNQSSIQIMTIHKAKGLEFDAVLLPSLEASLLKRGMDTPPFLWCQYGNDVNSVLLAPNKSRIQQETSESYKYLQHLINKQELAEFLRVLYVACTRAKKRLYLFAYTTQSKIKKSRSKSFVNDLVVKAKCDMFELPNQDIAHCEPTIIPALVRYTNADVYWRPTKLIADISPEKTIQQPRLTINIPAIIGTEVHAIIESIIIQPNIKEQLANEQLRNQFINRHSRQWKQKIRWCVPFDATKQAQNIVIGGISNMIHNDIGRWILVQQGQSEWKLQKKDSKGIITNKIIDRCFVDAGICWIIDYKIMAQKEQETKQQLQDRALVTYKNQLEQYAHILSYIEDRPIHLGIYLVSQSIWIDWHWQRKDN